MTISRASCDSARAMLTICLPAADSRPTSRPGGISAWPSRASRARVLARSWRAPGEAAARQLVAEEDVLGDRQAVDQVELLVDRRDARAQGRERRREGDLFALPADGAGVRLVGAGEHLDQGRLAGAVLPEQAVHLAGADLEVDAVEGADAGELLDDAGHLEQRGAHVDIHRPDRRASAGPFACAQD